MRRVPFVLLLTAVVCQLALCGFTSVADGIIQLNPLTHIATSLDDEFAVCGLSHLNGHTSVMAGNFQQKIRFVDGQFLADDSPQSGFLVAFDESTQSVVQKIKLPKTRIISLAQVGEKLLVSGQHLDDKTAWCGAEEVPDKQYFLAEFTPNGGEFTCTNPKSIPEPEGCSVVASDVTGSYATLCDKDPGQEISIHRTGISVATVLTSTSTIKLKKLIQVAQKYVLLGEFNGVGEIKIQETRLVALTANAGLFAILIVGNEAKMGATVTAEDQEISLDFAQLVGDKIIGAGVVIGNEKPVKFMNSDDVTITPNGRTLYAFDLKIEGTENVIVSSTWAASYPLSATIQFRDMRVYNNFAFFAHDEVESSVPLLANMRAVGVSAIDLNRPAQYAFVHPVSLSNTTAGPIAIEKGALIITGHQNDRDSIRLVISETDLPPFMNQPNVILPPVPVATPAPTAPAPIAPTAPTAPVPVPAPTAPVPVPISPIAPVPVPTAPIAPVPTAVPVAEQPKSVPKAETVVDDTGVFSTVWVVMAVLILVVGLVYFGLRFWRQYRSERQRFGGQRIRLDDRNREDDFYNP